MVGGDVEDRGDVAIGGEFEIAKTLT